MEEQSRFVLRVRSQSIVDDSFLSLQLDERRCDSLARESGSFAYLCRVLSPKPNRWPHDSTVMTHTCSSFIAMIVDSRLAANEKQYLSTIMQMRDPRHKRRLIIKATDVVLFGPPQRT